MACLPHSQLTTVTNTYCMQTAAMGLWQRNLTTPTSPELWVRPTLNNPASGPAVSVQNINFVLVHKQRIWVVERDQNHAHYLGIGAISGQTTAFFFGSKFKYGGGIAGLFNWTVDGGAGVDDYLVAVGEGGDLIPYKGIDPSQDDWQNVGSYYIGKPPVGGTFASEYAGELYFLSEFGVIAMSDILKGVDLGDSNRNPNSLSFLVTKLLRKDVSQRSDSYGWQMIFAPSRGDLIINTPERGVAQPIQYVLNLSMGAWSFWRGIPMKAVIDWNTSVFMLAAVPYGHCPQRICDGCQQRQCADNSHPPLAKTAMTYSFPYFHLLVGWGQTLYTKECSTSGQTF